MKSRQSIVTVYGPVLLAALLIFTAAPACAMPECGLGGSGAVSACGQVPQFKSACDLDSSHGSTTPEPCHGGTCDDSVMSHGSSDATAVSSVDVPAATAIAQAPRVPALVSVSISRAPVALPQPHPPDPLGVRLSV